MTGTTDNKDPASNPDGVKKTLTLSSKTLELKKAVGKDQVRQSFSHGRSKTVEVEVRRKRLPLAEKTVEENPFAEPTSEAKPSSVAYKQPAAGVSKSAVKLTHGELENRLKALQEAMKHDAVPEDKLLEVEPDLIEEEVAELSDQTVHEIAVDVVSLEQSFTPVSPSEQQTPIKKTETLIKKSTLQLSKKKPATPENFTPIVLRAAGYGPAKPPVKAEIKPTESQENIKHGDARAEEIKAPKYKQPTVDTDEENNRRKAISRLDVKRPPTARKTFEAPRKLNRTVLTKALAGDLEERARSLASLKRARQKYKMQQEDTESVKVIREVIIPESIMVGELANRMAVRGADVVKALMKSGMMVTINQVIDGDTAELLCAEFGHKPKRVADSDIELGLGGIEDKTEDMLFRAPVVTVMGHVDHGKTSLLDALRKTDVAKGEAGGITQHIGAYQVTLKSGQKITFIDTPGHAAFSEMRARGANVTDIVVLVVAADDGIMEQTIEAISHAKAAKVPIVVAINKMDKPEANPDRIRSDLLQHEVVLEEFGGDVMSVEVSAKQGLNLEKLEEAILLQAEVLDLKANPNRSAHGVVVESKIEKGRGSIATVLVQKGTLKQGDIFVAGTEWGRVRALVSDHGKPLKAATPSMPVEVLGLSGAPAAGEEFVVVDTEAKAREITEYRQHRRREASAANMVRSTMEEMMLKIAAGETRELPLVIKTDVQGSLEAITTSLAKLGTSEVSARILHGAVGGINESDVTLAKSSSGIIIGFNVRANPQARDLTRREGVEIRYYSIIYDALDDLKGLMSGMLAPTIREKFLGNVEIRNVFNITKVGKVAGCFVIEGMVKRGAKVRLLRDNVVMHEGDLKTLKRFKDEVKEVKESYECGMAFENYNDMRVGDLIECFELESISRQL